MIASAFLICALALPVGMIHHDDGGHNDTSKDVFIHEWKWLEELLKHQYPDSEFLILPKDRGIVPPGYEEVDLFWRNHAIYRRPKRAA